MYTISNLVMLLAIAFPYASATESDKELNEESNEALLKALNRIRELADIDFFIMDDSLLEKVKPLILAGKDLSERDLENFDLVISFSVPEIGPNYINQTWTKTKGGSLNKGYKDYRVVPKISYQHYSGGTTADNDCAKHLGPIIETQAVVMKEILEGCSKVSVTAIPIVLNRNEGDFITYTLMLFRKS